MEANKLIKRSLKAEDIISEIKRRSESDPCIYKHFVPHFMYISDEEKSKLICEGFKLYQGNWFNNEIGLIIEW